MRNAGAKREWMVERGIGEDRAILAQAGQIIAARMRSSGELPVGIVVPARLITRHKGTQRGVAHCGEADGLTVLVDKLPAQLSEGADMLIEVTRLPIAERGRLKHALGRVQLAAQPASSPLPDPFNRDNDVFRLPAGAWEEVWSAASAGEIEFGGGTALFSTTPAMTVIDIDGDLPPRDLALAAIPAIVQGINWFELAGNIGIDFPTLPVKADRRAVDDALAAALDDWPHERTAMNGFGFVQLVARLERPSLLHRFAASRTQMCALIALRLAEHTSGPGITLLTVHPALKARLRPEWLEELARRTGRNVRIETNPGLALEAPHAQIISQ